LHAAPTSFAVLLIVKHHRGVPLALGANANQ
jgi:hypothetical protein